MFGASQSFGYTQDAAPTQEAPKRARQEDKQTCVPVTVRILQDAVKRHAESQEILIHGTEAANVHVVGVVEGLVQQSAMIEFTVNDASGRMKVRYYGSSGSVEGFPGLAAGRYVSIIGALRTSPAAHLSAMKLQAVTGADDISYHMIEVAHAALRMKNPTKAAPTGFTAETPAKGLSLGLSGNTLSPAKVEAPVSLSTASVSMHTPPKADLRSAVVDMMNQVKDSAGEEGVTVSTLIGRLAGRDAPVDKVRDIIMQLVDEGEVFTTIDDDHFAMI